MRHDLFAGPSLRDDRHRILARLANGGSVPAPARQWARWNRLRHARLATVATLLATGAAAWVWLQNEGDQPTPGRLTGASPGAVLPAMPASGSTPGEDAPSRAAEIVTAVAPQSAPAATPSKATATITTTGAAMAASKSTEMKAVRPRPARAAGAPHRPQAAAAAPEGDEDVTLLAAMLKHAKPQKPSPTLPED
ncbi:hypothetical protein [Pseudoduganella sp. HUAS MS19]